MASTFVTELLKRQENADADAAAPACPDGNEYDGHMDLRISAIFVILVGASFGALFPIIASSSSSSLRMPTWPFFMTKYFGSGVIVATAFIHLLTPANEALTNPCLTGLIAEYPWAQGIAMISVFALCFVELLAARFAKFTSFALTVGSEASCPVDQPHIHAEPDVETAGATEKLSSSAVSTEDSASTFAAQLTSLFILEFGVVFHSLFIGLTLAVAGPEFTTLYPVLVFHQLFEGLALGARLAAIPWSRARRFTPHIMALVYGVSTPLAIAAGLAARSRYSPEGQDVLIVNGVFDALAAGVLLWTGLVELMGREFDGGRKGGVAEEGTAAVLGAFAWVCAGAGLMALLGKWA